MTETRTLWTGFAAKDTKLVADAVRALRKEGCNDGEIFRLALAGDDGLTRDHFEDMVALALERHPWGTAVERFPVGRHVELHPGTDDWMRGDRFGEVKGHVGDDRVKVKLNISGRTVTFAASDLLDKTGR